MERLLAAVAYSEASPSGLVWVAAPRSRRKAGDTAGSLDNWGYYRVCLDGKRFQTHRVVWVIHNGPIPEGFEVDHKDTNRGNNTIGNLRLATHTNNQHNKGAAHNSVTKVKGLSPVKSGGFRGDIECKGKRYYVTGSREYVMQWLITTRAELHGDFANNG